MTKEELIKPFIRNGKELAVPQVVVNCWTQLKDNYELGIIPFYNPIAMTYELMTQDEYNELLHHLYTIRRKETK